MTCRQARSGPAHRAIPPGLKEVGKSTTEAPAVAARRELGGTFEGEPIGPDDR